MVKRYSHHTFPVQSPHTMDAILFRDVNKRNCGYRPLITFVWQKCMLYYWYASNLSVEVLLQCLLTFLH